MTPPSIAARLREVALRLRSYTRREIQAGNLSPNEESLLDGIDEDIRSLAGEIEEVAKEMRAWKSDRALVTYNDPTSVDRAPAKWASRLAAEEK